MALARASLVMPGMGASLAAYMSSSTKISAFIESATQFFPDVLGAREAGRLKKHQEAVELAAASGFERGANFDRVMAIVVDHGDVVDDAFDIEAAADAGKFGEAFADE